MQAPPVAKLSKRGGRPWVGEGLCQGLRCDDGCIDGACFRHWALVWKKLHCFGSEIGSGLWNIESVAAIVFRGGTQIPSVNPMGGPSAAVGGDLENLGFFPWRCKGGSIEIKGATIEFCLCGESRIDY